LTSIRTPSSALEAPCPVGAPWKASGIALGEIEILRLALATGDVAQVTTTRSGIAHRHVHIGFERIS
jgi:hypothetical protein